MKLLLKITTIELGLLGFIFMIKFATAPTVLETANYAIDMYLFLGLAGFNLWILGEWDKHF